MVITFASVALYDIFFKKPLVTGTPGHLTADRVGESKIGQTTFYNYITDQDSFRNKVVTPTPREG